MSLKYSSYKLKLHIARLVMQTKMQNKQLEKKNLKKDVKRIGIQIKHLLGLILCNTLIYQINEMANSRLKIISLRHINKLIRSREHQNKPRKDEQQKIHQQILHN